MPTEVLELSHEQDKAVMAVVAKILARHMPKFRTDKLSGNLNIEVRIRDGGISSKEVQMTYLER
jgi:hypothetical protein